MEVHGIDMTQGAYRISFKAGSQTLCGLVPETLVSELLRQSGRPGHGDAYQWIAAHRLQIEKALIAKSRGDTKIRAPYDRLSLVEE